MAWRKTPADRQRDAKTYDNPEYRRNRPLAMKRDRWQCQLRLPGCAGAASQCDHITQPEHGGGHSLANLRAVCKACHATRSARQGNDAKSGSRPDPQPQPRTTW